MSRAPPKVWRLRSDREASLYFGSSHKESKEDETSRKIYAALCASMMENDKAMIDSFVCSLATVIDLQYSLWRGVTFPTMQVYISSKRGVFDALRPPHSLGPEYDGEEAATQIQDIFKLTMHDKVNHLKRSRIVLYDSQYPPYETGVFFLIGPKHSPLMHCSYFDISEVRMLDKERSSEPVTVKCLFARKEDTIDWKCREWVPTVCFGPVTPWRDRFGAENFSEFHGN